MVESDINALPLCMVTLDLATLRPLQCNAMFERHIGPLHKFANDDFVLAASDDKASDARPKLREALEKAAAADAGADRVRVRDVEMTTLAGESGFPIRRLFDWFASKSDDGASLILLGDPIGERDAEEREKEAELIDFFNNAPIALHWLTGEGKVLWANQTELNVLGYTEEEYFGQDIMQFCPDEKELVLEIFKQLGSGNAIRDVPVRFRTKDGRIVNLLIDSNMKYDKDGSFGHTRCFIRDDTGRKIRDARASLLLEETNRSLKMLDNFMARSLHHLRTPLHVTQNMVDAISALLKSAAEVSSEKSECLELCQLAADQIGASISLMNDVSDLEKFVQGSVMHTNPEIVTLEKFGKKMLKDVPTPKGDVQVLLELGRNGDASDEGPSMAVTDPIVLQRVLHHLLNNAVDVTESGTITLGIGYKNGRLTFTVADTGPGLEMAPGAAEGDLPTIFQRYHSELLPEEKVDLTIASTLRVKIELGINSQKKNGLGIGLGLTYHLVQALGGELRCVSKKGKGTRFQFSLPRTASYNSSVPVTPSLASMQLARTPPVTAKDNKRALEEVGHPVSDLSSSGSTSSDSGPSKKKGRTDIPSSFEMPTDVLPEVPASRLAAEGVKTQVPPSILVVEDTKACAKMLCMILTKFQCSPKWAENGQIAVDILKEAPPGTYDLILMDLRMPVMDGLEATKVIKHELGITAPVVALTGDDNDATRKECEGIGFDAFQGKPMKRNELKAVIQQFTGYEVK
ncbi:hypothetical protein ACHAXT_000365 [Thalassiosira profunda]